MSDPQDASPADPQDTPPPAGPVREVVGVFTDRPGFENAVRALSAAGFAQADISILSSHSSLEAAFAEPDEEKSLSERLLPFLGELRYETPLITAGLIALASGPTAAAVAGLVAAGVGGLAVKDLLDEIAAEPHREEFEQALKDGNILLWVAIKDAGTETRARQILAEAGARDIHLHDRPAG
ncbi:hypothetical protein [Roseospirillum parvum]|uniref:General stress protein 17M-like domain-containing protein n=1 Tax=Roseospirillum parvum TaxID=83401 RepID=A0A1G7X1J2_9PROT|nr:hypothetical protein [Roseospirillum parvum]SDG78007.1 hypothetical protein SAMN05421742_102397 [Roseospirillum parvum]